MIDYEKITYPGRDGVAHVAILGGEGPGVGGEFGVLGYRLGGEAEEGSGEDGAGIHDGRLYLQLRSRYGDVWVMDEEAWQKDRFLKHGKCTCSMRCVLCSSTKTKIKSPVPMRQPGSFVARNFVALAAICGGQSRAQC